MKTSLLRSVILLGLISVTPFAYALKSDRFKPMDIVADRVDIDDKKGISTFRGDVHVKRGTMQIRGDVVVVHRNKKNEVETIVATGDRALYRQRPDNKPDDVVAHAMRINYDAINEIVTLTRKGEITQSGDIFKGEHLVYHAKTDKVKASSGGTKESNGRVRMILQPSDIKK